MPSRSRCAIWLACRALASHTPLPSSPSHGAVARRIFELSCPACLTRHSNSSASPASKNTTASPKPRPFLVPPNDTTSMPRAPGQVGGLAFERRNGIGQPRAVHVQLEPVALCGHADRIQFFQGIDRPHLGRLRDATQPAP